MSLIRHYSKKEIREKFRRYRILFFSGIGVFFLALVCEIFLYGSGGTVASGEKVVLESFFLRLFCLEEGIFLLSFLFGVTLYAPFFQFAALGIRGAFSGFILSSLCTFSQGGEKILLFFFALLYLVFSTLLFCGYTSFCTAVSLRIFTDSALKKYRIDETNMFGGTLFNSTFFCNTVNLRFLFSYTLIFLAAFLLSGLSVFVYSFFRSLLF